MDATIEWLLPIFTKLRPQDLRWPIASVKWLIGGTSKHWTGDRFSQWLNRLLLRPQLNQLFFRCSTYFPGYLHNSGLKITIALLKNIILLLFSALKPTLFLFWSMYRYDILWFRMVYLFLLFPIVLSCIKIHHNNAQWGSWFSTAWNGDGPLEPYYQTTTLHTVFQVKREPILSRLWVLLCNKTLMWIDCVLMWMELSLTQVNFKSAVEKLRTHLLDYFQTCTLPIKVWTHLLIEGFSSFFTIFYKFRIILKTSTLRNIELYSD